MVKVISTETDGGGNLDIIDYTSDYIESGGSIGFSESFPDRSNDAEFFRNARMRFSFGSNGMNPGEPPISSLLLRYLRNHYESIGYGGRVGFDCQVSLSL